jgi:trigger factor
VKYVVTADAKLIDGQNASKTIWYSSSSRRGCSWCRFNGNVYKRRKRNNATTISLDIFKDKATADKYRKKSG